MSGFPFGDSLNSHLFSMPGKISATIPPREAPLSPVQRLALWTPERIGAALLPLFTNSNVIYVAPVAGVAVRGPAELEH